MSPIGKRNQYYLIGGNVSGELAIVTCVLGDFITTGWDDCHIGSGEAVVVSAGDSLLSNSALSTRWTFDGSEGVSQQEYRSNFDGCTTIAYNASKQPVGCASGFKIRYRVRFVVTSGTLSLQAQSSLFEIDSGSTTTFRDGSNNSTSGAGIDQTVNGELSVAVGVWVEPNLIALEMTMTFSAVNLGDQGFIEFEFSQPEPL